MYIVFSKKPLLFYCISIRISYEKSLKKIQLRVNVGNSVLCLYFASN